MKELLDRFLMYFCFAGIGAIAVATIIRAVYDKWKMKNEEWRMPRRISHSPFSILRYLIPIFCVCRLIVHAGAKSDSSPDSNAPSRMCVEDSRTGVSPVQEEEGMTSLFQNGQDARSTGSASEACSVAQTVTTHALMRVEKWWRRGAYDDGQVLTFDEDWCFPYGTNHLTTEIPYDIPFAHDGFGQDEDWVRANFDLLHQIAPSLTNAEEIVSVGYANWVDDQVGVGLTNGLYKFTAEFLEDPPEPTQLTIGGCSVCVTNAGAYSFVLEKGEVYAFGTWPFNEAVDYRVQDNNRRMGGFAR